MPFITIGSLDSLYLSLGSPGSHQRGHRLFFPGRAAAGTHSLAGPALLSVSVGCAPRWGGLSTARVYAHLPYLHNMSQWPTSAPPHIHSHFFNAQILSHSGLFRGFLRDLLPIWEAGWPLDMMNISELMGWKIWLKIIGEKILINWWVSIKLYNMNTLI